MNSRSHRALVALSVQLFALSAYGSKPEVVASIPVETEQQLKVQGVRGTQEVWLEMIKGARQSIDIEQFYITSKPGHMLEPVLEAIKDAGRRGVHVRVMADAGFYRTYPNDLNSLGQTPNIEAKTISFASLGGIQHAKFFIVDRKLAYEGSANFDWAALEHIHEVGIKTDDAKSVAGMESIFEMDWSGGMASFVQKKPGNLLAEIIPGADDALLLAASPARVRPQGIADSLEQINAILDSAHSKVQIQVYEYTTHRFKGNGTWNNLDDAIRRTAARGVQVELMVDHVAMKAGSQDLNALARTRNVSVKTVTIPEHSSGPIPYARLIHSKYLIVDGTSGWVGTENWQDSYFETSRNLGLIIRMPEVAADLAKLFGRLWSSDYAQSL